MPGEEDRSPRPISPPEGAETGLLVLAPRHPERFGPTEKLLSDCSPRSPDGATST